MTTTSAREAGSDPAGAAPAAGRRSWWAQPYLWLSLLALALLLPACANLPWGGDYGIHAATLERLRAHLADPGNPMVDADTPSPYYSPWTVLLALVARATGWSTLTMLSLGGAVAVLFLLSGVWRFTRALGGARWAPVLLLLCMMLLWGARLFAWSGFFPLSSIVVSIGYPSTLAWGLTLHLWAWLPGAGRRGWPLRATLPLGVFATLILLVHQFTGVIMLLGAAAFIVSGRRQLRDRGWLRLLAGTALIALLLAVWPYYSFFALHSPLGENAIHEALYQHTAARFGLAALGLPALFLRWRRNRLDPLLLLFLACAVVYAFGWFSGHYAFGRILPGAMLALQAALALEVASGSGGRLARLTLAPLTALALLGGLWVQAGSVSYALTDGTSLAKRMHVQVYPLNNGYSWVTRYVKYGQVVMTDDYYAARRVPAYGGYVVYCPYPDPFLADWLTRQRDTHAFFSAATGQTARTALLAKYHARWIIQAAHDGVDLSRWYHKVAVGPNGETLYRA